MINWKNELVEKTKSFLMSRKTAYVQVFNPESVAVQEVLKDLSRFCKVTDTSFHADPRIHAAYEGRREVFLRIQSYLKLNSDELWEKYGRKDI